MTGSSNYCRRGWGPSAFGQAVTCAFLFFESTVGCQSSGPGQELRGTPDERVERWVTMWNSYDLDEVPELFLDDPRLTYFSSEKEGVIRGMEAVLEHHRGFGFVPGGVERPSRLWLADVETDLYGDLAVVTGLWLFQSGEAGEEDPQRGPVTIVAVWRSGDWRFIHMNFSEYVSPDSS